MNRQSHFTNIILFLCALGTAQAATYYVSTSGNDSNSGSSTAPLKTISHAAAVATQPGDTVIVMNGTYSNGGVVAPNFVVTLNHSGTSAAPITFKAQNRAKAILNSGNTSTSSTCNGASAYFNLANASFIVIQGFVIENACNSGIQSNDDAHDITIRWNIIRYIGNHWYTESLGLDGIFLNNNEYNFTFDGNMFYDIGRTGGLSYNNLDHGIYSHSQNTTIINNIFYNISKGWAIQQADGADNWLIANNTFAFPSAGSGQIMLWDNATNLTIQNNIFYEPVGYAIERYTSVVNGCAVTNNLVYGASVVMDNSTGCNLSANEVGPNPMFINATTSPYNFDLQSSSPAINQGVYLSTVTTDYLGNTRPSGPTTDTGAYEYMGQN
ncbi:MAG TPA: choice-of-anchor Q domain-containing protein [Bryobacteraceae bacterium]|nr:choice-of-anchor Q domain-containing protein [Bryobacteraceae bacterium]